MDLIERTTLEKAVAWAQTKSMWPATFGLACCAIEMMSIVGARYDIARFGMEAFRASPRQADLMIVSGRVSTRWRPLRQIYDQMLEPKWVIAMGACASSGGMFNNYAIVPGRRQDRPVDMYVPGLPAAARGADGRHPQAARGCARDAAALRERGLQAPGLASTASTTTPRSRGSACTTSCSTCDAWTACA
jgi:NADH-quinone oxidoreductase B subunit